MEANKPCNSGFLLPFFPMARAGDSFPDIGVLENLSGILDVKIQDIVVGEISADDTGRGKENIITEVIRMAKLQEKSKRERIIYCLGGIVILLYSLFLALTGMNGSIVVVKCKLDMISVITHERLSVGISHGEK